MSNATIANSGYRMPAEWDAHTSTWIAWPHNAEDWPGKFQPIPWVYSEIVRHLSQVEQVNILVNDERAQKVATRILTRAGANLARLHFHLWRTDRIWAARLRSNFRKESKRSGCDQLEV